MTPEPSSRPDRRGFLAAGGTAALSTAAYARIPGANERVGVGFIGFGLIGKRHVLDFKGQKDAALVAVAEAHRGRLAEAKETMGGSPAGYADFRKLLDDKNVDAVVVSTPDHWHALMTMLACAAGKDVYVEKPLTLFVREGRWMVDVAKRHKRVVQVGTQQRSGPHYAKARELIRAGRLGKVASVRMAAYRNIMPGFGRPADCDPPTDLDWEMFLGPAPKRPYNPNRGIYHFRWFWDTSGGQMTNLGQHALDIVHWCLGQEPTEVSSSGGRFCLEDNGETPDTQDALFEFPGRTAVWSHREGGGTVPGRTPPLEFCGTKGSLVLSRSGFTLTPDRKVPPANRVPQASGSGHPVGGPRPVKAVGPPEFWTEPAEGTGSELDQFQRHVRNFLDCVKSREQPVSDLENGHRVATMCHLANLSFRLGRKLRWDAAKEDVIGDAVASKLLLRPYRAPWDKEFDALKVT
jgi:predicted dehydrogenase